MTRVLSANVDGKTVTVYFSWITGKVELTVDGEPVDTSWDIALGMTALFAVVLIMFWAKLQPVL